MWTQFWDMYSGGGQKEKFAICFIEAPMEEAKIIFYNRFGHNPERVTCTCCGEDYSISEGEDLAQLTAYHRNCRYAYFKADKEVSYHEGWICGKGHADGVTSRYVEEADSTKTYQQPHIKLEDFLKQTDVCVIYAKDIKPGERTGTLPEQGYVWHD